MSSLVEQLYDNMGLKPVDMALANIQSALERMRQMPSSVNQEATDASWDKAGRSFEMLELAGLLQDCGKKDLTGDDVRRMRLALGFSVNDLSHFLGYSTVMIENWEIGRMPVPKTIKMIFRLMILARKA